MATDVVTWYGNLQLDYVRRNMSLDKIIADINKKYGDGALVRGADARGLKINRLKTGSLSLDAATGGGWAMGKINEIFGPYSGGKTYVSLLTVAQTQKDYPDANVAWIDFEGAFDKVWAQAIGVDTDRLLISSPEFMEDGLQIASELIQSGDVILVVVDSLAAACPKAEYEGDISDFTVGLRARLGNKFIRKSKSKSNLLDAEVDLGKTTLLLINQIYAGIGPYAGEETPGGVQVKFGSMVRVRIRKGDLLQDKDGAVLMQESRFTVEKNKTYPPKKTGSFSFSCKDNPKGKTGQIYRAGEIITFGTLTGIIRKAGAWYYLPESFGDEKFQGADKVADWIVEHPEEYARLEALIVEEIPNLV